MQRWLIEVPATFGPAMFKIQQFVNTYLSSSGISLWAAPAEEEPDGN